MTSAAVSSKAMILLILLFLFCSYGLLGFGVGSLFCHVVLGILSSLAITLLRKRELVGSL